MDYWTLLKPNFRSIQRIEKVIYVVQDGFWIYFLIRKKIYMRKKLSSLCLIWLEPSFYLQTINNPYLVKIVPKLQEK